MIALNVSSIGKSYRYYNSAFKRFMYWIFDISKYAPTTKWILRDISFKANFGESIAIVGINGAGKSTLLKIISGTIKQSEGEVILNGKVSCLLELGLGFHSDFTGRQNVYSSAQALGLSNTEINRLMPEIENFAEIGDYIDRPIRTYSTGMQARLAFSVVTAVRPQILIVDEVLSVGDTYFQHKSIERIKEYKKLGTTIIFVSHDSSAILSLCDRAILLDSGILKMDGDPKNVIDFYNASLSLKNDVKIKQSLTKEGNLQTVSGNGYVTFNNILLTDDKFKEIDTVTVGQQVCLRISFVCNKYLEKIVIGYLIKDRLGLPVFGTNTQFYDMVIKKLVPNQVVNFDINFSMNLAQGSYSLSIAAHSDASHLNDNYEWRDHALIFQVVNISTPHFVGVAWLPPKISIFNIE